MPDLIRHPVPSWIPAFIRLWRIRRNDGFGVFSCRSNNPVALDLLKWLIAGHSLLYNNWVLYLNLNCAILIPGPPDRHSGEPRIKVRGRPRNSELPRNPLDSGFRDCVVMKKTCHSGRAMLCIARSGNQKYSIIPKTSGSRLAPR
jgi:hypothetical protein